MRLVAPKELRDLARRIAREDDLSLSRFGVVKRAIQLIRDEGDALGFFQAERPGQNTDDLTFPTFDFTS